VKTSFELEVIQNTAIGAAALWQFSEYFQRSSTTGAAPDLARLMLVLPLAFHRRSAECIATKQFKSGLLKILYDAPELVVGLQARMQAMYRRTLRSLSLASSVGLIERTTPEGSLPHYAALRRELPHGLKPTHGDVKMVLSCSRRLGTWLSGHDLAFVCVQLHIRF
jgi:hypothetical protein